MNLVEDSQRLSESEEEEENDEDEYSPRRRSRRAVKSEKNIADLEDLKFNPPTSTSKRKTAAEPTTTSPESTSTLRKPKSDVASPKKAKKLPSKPKAIPQSLDTPHPAPPHWRETYDTIKEMRSRFVAPVDTMGCQQAQVAESDPKNRRYATLVSLMLSSQTKDEVTNAAIDNLREALGGSITIDAMIAAEDAVISKAIAKVGFWNRKTTYLKQAAIRLRDHFNSDVPKTVDELCSLPGVGPKMSFLCLQIAWDVNDGIGVDVHVHRITNLLRWHKPPTKTPEQTRLNLQSWLPKELYGEINHMLVGFGQVICLPVGPRCDLCDLSKKGLCPSAQKVTSKNRKAVVFTRVQEESKESPAKVEVTLEEEVEEKEFILKINTDS
ncbi:DNA glycosylase [Gymnopilus junonius]|uniref:Endonuclease III homolog n=1 Tax=Gymnopilus junonius TaxID=109634 RepID=A0A9P5NAW6_GYMJU|nr:DNA glycosylase [Gymnopilus junonius]